MQQYLHLVVNEIKRLSPLLIFTYILLGVKELKEKNILIIGYIFNTVLNFVLKNYNFFIFIRENDYPIIGLGTRPKNAMNCDLWSSGKNSTTYGMPSGHAQLITFFIMFQLFKNKPTNNNNRFKSYFNKFLLILLWGYLLYSRVELGCHTYQQVIIGSMVGAITSYGIIKWYY